MTSPLPSPVGAAARRPEEQGPRPSSEAASPQPPYGGPQLQPEGAAGGERGGAAAAERLPAAAPGGREVLPHPPAQKGAERPVGAGGKAAPF